MSERAMLKLATVIIIGLCAAPSGLASDPLIGAPTRHNAAGALYSPWHYRTPTLYRLYARRFAGRISMYAPDRFPDVTPAYQFRIDPYPDYTTEMCPLGRVSRTR